MSFQTPITIYQAISNIQSNDYLLPAFQRNFVWKRSQIEKLFDSLMQGYPINSMLFWKVKVNTTTDFNFYQFIDHYIERHNTQSSTKIPINKDFCAILDGQQRLTALYLGLCGSYANHKSYKPWDNNSKSFPQKKLYLCLNKINSEEDNDNKYLFEFKEIAITKDTDLYYENENTWFKVAKILNLRSSLNTDNEDIDDFCDNNNLGKSEKKMIRRLENIVFTQPTINYYEEDEQNPDKAVNIFTRINSGGTYLSFSNIIFSLLVANWKIDARNEINTLVNNINNKGFSISNDYILKAMLFLHHKLVKFSINSFSKSFCKILEENWNEIRDCIESLFDLLGSFGLDSNTLTSNNATLPILYYLYHKNIYKDYTIKVQYKDDRKKIKKWLLSVLLLQIYGGHVDSTLSLSRKAFTDDIDKQTMNSSVAEFPEQALSVLLKKESAVNDEIIYKWLDTQKDNKYCFAILALLYPNLDYKNNNFHKDHLHPWSMYDELPEDLKQKYPKIQYNSIVNLQMLDANENMSKNGKSLKKWVDLELKDGRDKKQFLDYHLIPDIDLSLGNFDEFYERRKQMLADKLMEILS